MRTFFIIFILVIIACLGYLGYAQFSGGAVPTFGLPIGGERAKVRERTHRFFEHVKFKNASALHEFVSPDTTSNELTTFLFKSLDINPDVTDLTDVHIDQVELNNAETRARVRVTLSGQNLSTNTAFQTTKLIFLYKSKQDSWLVDINNVAL